MKNAVLFLSLLILTISGCSAGSGSLEAFQARLDLACKTKNFDGFKALYDCDGVPPDSSEKSMARWSKFFDPNDSWQFIGVTFQSTDQLMQDPAADHAQVLKLLHPYDLNGTMSEVNLSFAGFVHLAYRKGDQDTTVNLPVGCGPDGTYRICLVRPVP
jgi:hypothetical protein